MSASAYSSSASMTTWPTPDSGVFNDGEEPESFLDRQARQKAKGINGNGMGMTLAMASKVWPTPNALDGEKAPKQFAGGNPSLPALAKMWNTPKASDALSGADRVRRDTGKPQSALPTDAILWSTPRASDGEKGGPNQSFGAGGQPLPAQATQWPTPTSLSYGESHQPGNSRSVNLTLERAEDLYSRLALTTVKTGKPSSKERRSLNPLFVEWLMGWPPGWTLLVSSDFACSATALSRFKRRMRCALSPLVLHDAPPAQVSLFG